MALWSLLLAQSSVGRRSIRSIQTERHEVGREDGQGRRGRGGIRRLGRHRERGGERPWVQTGMREGSGRPSGVRVRCGSDGAFEEGRAPGPWETIQPRSLANLTGGVWPRAPSSRLDSAEQVEPLTCHPRRDLVAALELPIPTWYRAGGARGPSRGCRCRSGGPRPRSRGRRRCRARPAATGIRNPGEKASRWVKRSRLARPSAERVGGAVREPGQGDASGVTAQGGPAPAPSARSRNAHVGAEGAGDGVPGRAARIGGEDRCTRVPGLPDQSGGPPAGRSAGAVEHDDERRRAARPRDRGPPRRARRPCRGIATRRAEDHRRCDRASGGGAVSRSAAGPLAPHAASGAQQSPPAIRTRSRRVRPRASCPGRTFGAARRDTPVLRRGAGRGDFRGQPWRTAMLEPPITRRQPWHRASATSWIG